MRHRPYAGGSAHRRATARAETTITPARSVLACPPLGCARPFGISRVEYSADLVKDVLNKVDDLDEADAEAVMTALPDGMFDAVLAAQGDDWLDAEMMIAIDRALWDELGEKGFDMFWIGFASQAARAPKLRNLAAGIIRIFVSPRIVIEQMVKSYARVSRGLGRFESEFIDANVARVEIHDMGQLSDLRLFALANRACFEGALRLAGRSSNVTVEWDQEQSSWCRFEIAW